MDISTGIIENTTFFMTTTFEGRREVEIIIEAPVTSLTSNIIITLIIFFFLVFGSAGNILTLVVIAKTKSLHIPSNYFIVSLCISDLISALLCSPLWLYKRTWGFSYYDWGLAACQVYWVSDFTTNYATSLHILSFSVLRFIAVKKPFFVASITRKVVLTFIIGIWIFAVLLSVPLLWLVGVENNRALHSIGKDWPACSILLQPNRTCCVDQYNTYMTVVGPIFFYIPELLVIYFSVTIARALLRRRRWMRGFSSAYNISDQIPNVSSVRSRNSSNRSSIKSNKPSEEKNRADEQPATKKKPPPEENDSELDNESASSENPMQQNIENNSERPMDKPQDCPEDSFEVEEGELSKSNVDERETNEGTMVDETVSESAPPSTQNEVKGNDIVVEPTRSKTREASRNSISSVANHEDIVIELDDITIHDETTFTKDFPVGESGYVNEAFENDEHDTDGTLKTPKYDISRNCFDNEDPNRSSQHSQSIASQRLECNSSTNRPQNSEIMEPTSEQKGKDQKSDDANENDKSDVIAGVTRDHNEQNITESSPISISSHSQRNYGTNDEKENGMPVQEADIQQDGINDAKTNEDSAQSRLGPTSDSLTVEGETQHFKIRSSSFYDMKADKTNKYLEFDSTQSLRNRNGKFQARHASFHSTIQEEPQKDVTGSNKNTTAISSRRHQRMASEGYSYPILYNRRISTASYVPEERRTHSFYRERRRPTVTSEKSVYEYPASSRRASNASIALERQYEKERATFTQLCLVNFSFMVGYVPITVYLMWTSNVTSDSRNRDTDYWFGVIAYMCLRFSECMNPVIYNFSSGNIRDATRKYLRRVFGREQNT